MATPIIKTPGLDDVNRGLRNMADEEPPDINQTDNSLGSGDHLNEVGFLAMQAGASPEDIQRLMRVLTASLDPKTYTGLNGSGHAVFTQILDDFRVNQNGHGNGTIQGFNVTRMSDVVMKPVEWLWEGKFPIGKVSGISGDPGLGKSQITASMTAIVTVGGQWPVTRDRAPKGNVILLNAEDDNDDTIGPRLEAAGADLSRVFVLNAIKVESDGEEGERNFDLSRDIKNLQDLMAKIGDVRLVIIDPVSAYMGKADSHNNAEVRGVLAPLKDAAAKHRAAIVLVNHLNKSKGSSALHRTQGSVAFTGAPRAVWGVVKDKDNPERRLFLPLKNNLGPDTHGLAYSVEGFRLEGSDPAINTSRISWETEAVTETADNAMSDDDGEHSAMDEAEDFLKDALSFGARPVNDIINSARKANISQRTLNRAKSKLRIKSVRSGFGPDSKYTWTLPD